MYLHLKGQYRIQVFGKTGNLKSDSNFVDNLITKSGLRFPTGVPFADCFRYLSLGSGTVAPTINDTGLLLPISEFQYFGPYKALYTGQLRPSPPNPWPEDSYYVEEGCGTTVQSDSIQLFRTWRVPTGANTAEIDYTGTRKITELMVSPSAPVELLMRDSSTYSFPAHNYLSFPPMNQNVYAFSKLATDFTLTSGDYSMISYKLTVYPQIEPSTFNFQLNSSRFRKDNTNNLIPCTGWTGDISGIGGLIHAGIKIIHINVKPPGSNLPNPVGFFADRGQYYGLSVTPYMGSPLDPSENKYACTLSSDNLQFLVNPNGGAVLDTGTFYPWNLTGAHSSGVCSYQSQLTTGGSAANFTNLRTSYSPIHIPNSGDITSSNVGPMTGWRTEEFISQILLDGSDNPYKAVQFLWTQPQPNLPPAPISSAVVSITGVETNTTPPRDFAFYDVVLNAINTGILPIVQTGINGNPDSGIYGYYPIPDGNKLYADALNNLSFGFRLTWGA